MAYHFEYQVDFTYDTIDARVNDGVRLGIPSFLTEYHIHSTELLERAQKYQQSWLFWKYKPYGKDWGSSFPHELTASEDIIVE